MIPHSPAKTVQADPHTAVRKKWGYITSILILGNAAVMPPAG